jgi:hypothetical protein
MTTEEYLTGQESGIYLYFVCPGCKMTNTFEFDPLIQSQSAEISCSYCAEFYESMLIKSILDDILE